MPAALMSYDEPPVLLPATVPPEFVKGGGDWLCMFNPSVRRVMDIKQQAVISHNRQVYSVGFSSDCSRVAVGVDSGVYLYDVHGSGKHKLECCDVDTGEGPSSNPVRSVAFSPDGTMLAAAADDMKIRIWQLPTCELAHTLVGHQREITSIAFTADSATIISASGDRTLRLWTLPLFSDYYSSFYSSASDGSASPEPEDLDIADVTDEIECTVLSIEADFTVAATALTSLALSPDRLYAAVGTSGGMIRIWNLQDCAPIGEWQAHDREIFTLHWGRSGLVSGGRDRKLVRWSLPSHTLHPFVAPGVDAKKTMKHEEYVLAAATAQHGRVPRAASGSRDGRLQLWDPKTGELLFCVIGHKNSVTAVDLSQDGALLVSGSGDGEVRIWSYTII
ncbi:unnamed protein product [Peniophora sp. CBMAI 1063]|nr:unnamed protein product [Peniophora sp. CBMAI 1063]